MNNKKLSKAVSRLSAAAVAAAMLVMLAGCGGSSGEPAGTAGGSQTGKYEVETLKDDQGRVTQEPATLEDGTPVCRTYYYSDIDGAVYMTDFDTDGIPRYQETKQNDRFMIREWYDESGNTLCTENYGEDGTLGNTIRYTYNEKGAKLSKITEDAAGKVTAQEINTIENDVIARTDFTGSDGVVYMSQFFGYDENKNMTLQCDYMSPQVASVTLFEYNGDNNKTSEAVYNSAGRLLNMIVLSYDSDGYITDSVFHSDSDEDWKEIAAEQGEQIVIEDVIKGLAIQPTNLPSTDRYEQVPEEPAVPDDTETEQAEATEKPSQDQSVYFEPTTLGSWDGKVYRNEYLGVQADLEGFEAFTVPGSREVPAADSEDLTSTSRFLWVEHRDFLDLCTKSSDNCFVQILYHALDGRTKEYMLENGQKKLVENYVNDPEEQEKAKQAAEGTGVTLISNQAAALQFAGRECWGILKTTEIDGTTMYDYSIDFADVKGRYAVMVNLSAPSVEQLDALLARFEAAE